MAFAAALDRVLRHRPVQRVLSTANANVMALYLWHMIPVVIVAIVAYPAGLIPQPHEGSAAWWLVRLEWITILSVVTAVEMLLLWWQRRFFAVPLPTFGLPLGDRWAEAIMLTGAVLAAVGLHLIGAGRLRAGRAVLVADRRRVRRRGGVGGGAPQSPVPRCGPEFAAAPERLTVGRQHVVEPACRWTGTASRHARRASRRLLRPAARNRGGRRGTSIARLTGCRIRHTWASRCRRGCGVILALGRDRQDRRHDQRDDDCDQRRVRSQRRAQPAEEGDD